MEMIIMPLSLCLWSSPLSLSPPLSLPSLFHPIKPHIYCPPKFLPSLTPSMEFQRPENAARRAMMMRERATITHQRTAAGEEDGSDEEDDEKKQRRVAGAGGGGRRVSGGGICCQAEKCTADLTEAKRYHRRHKVCEFHAKAPSVLVSGLRQRFCQQCSRFHELSEFDEAKRSCRRRLAGHNERRRKSTTDSQQGESSSSSTSASASTMGRPKGPNGPSTQQPQCRPADHERASRVMSYPPGNPAAYKHFHIR